MRSGAAGFEAHELLELLLTYAIPRRDVNGLAHRLIDRFGSLTGVLSASVEELAAVDGLGESAAVFFALIRDVLSKTEIEKLQSGGTVTLDTAAAAARYALAVTRGERNESCRLLLLDTKRHLLSEKTIGAGTVDGAEIYPRLAAEAALLSHARYAILLHNHPSGDPRPSKEDLEATEAVQHALETVGVTLLEHLIAGNGTVFCLSSGELIGG